MYFPFHTNIVSNNIEEAKKRGSFIYEYEIPPIIEYNNSPAEIKLEEIFLERIQRYNVFKNKLINRNGYNLVFVYSERGKEIVADWNSQHRYYKLVGQKYGRFKISFYNHWNPYHDTPLDSLYADTLVLCINDLFIKNRRKYPPEDVQKQWENQPKFGMIYCIKKLEARTDSSVTKWFL